MSYSPSVNEHRQAAPRVLTFAVLTVSDSRTLDTDRSGQLIVDLLQAAGHTLQVRNIVPDEPERIRGEAERWCREERIDVILLTGGTGISPRDQTPEAIRPLLEVELPGFGELFRWLSYQEIGPAAMLSRALAGRCAETLIFCLPGSTAAVRLACEQLLVPELPHLVHHSRASS